MNTQHLQYVVEIERMRSISQAAENLFIGQPNLSRILHDMEDSLGFKIFERTSRGVRPTERGTIFLQHAKSILREMDSIEALGPRRPVANRLRICIPRSAAMLDLTSEFIATLPDDQNLDVAIRECHARKALELLANGEVEIGIIDLVVVGGTLAVIELIHIRVVGGLPCSNPAFRLAGLVRSEQVGSVGHIVDDQVEADGLQSRSRVRQNLERRVVAVAGAADIGRRRRKSLSADSLHCC